MLFSFRGQATHTSAGILARTLGLTKHLHFSRRLNRFRKPGQTLGTAYRTASRPHSTRYGHQVCARLDQSRYGCTAGVGADASASTLIAPYSTAARARRPRPSISATYPLPLAVTPVRPNHSLKLTPHGLQNWPRGAYAHAAPRGQFRKPRGSA